MRNILASPSALLTDTHARRICAFPRSPWNHQLAIPFPVALPSQCRQLHSARHECHQGWPKASSKQSLGKIPEKEPSLKLNHHGNDSKSPPPPLGKENKLFLREKHGTDPVLVKRDKRVCMWEGMATAPGCSYTGSAANGREDWHLSHSSMETHAKFMGVFIALWWVHSVSELILEIQGPLWHSSSFLFFAQIH